jgi:streptogramin lyase
MRRRLGILLMVTAALAGAWQFYRNAEPALAAQQAPLLSGIVRSMSGEALEGVTVSAWLVGKPVTTSVFTDAQGGYYFPPLPAGKYRVRAQAPGYEKSDAAVELAGASSRQEFKIAPTKDFFSQLTGDQQMAAWPEDTPGHRRMKDVFRRNCTGCHEANVALQNRFDQRGWAAIITAMSRVATAGGFADPGRPDNRALSYFKKDLATYLAEVRGPGAPLVQPKLPPRPSGEATLAVVYEYDVPVESADGYLPNNGSDWSLGPVSGSGGGIGLHDAHVDRDGNVWMTDNTAGSMTRTIAKVDGRTGEVTKYKYPGKNGGAGHAHGMVVARNGMVWFTLSTGNPFATGGVEDEADGTPGGIFGRLDPRTGKLDAFIQPKDMAETTISIDEDGQGNIWASTPKGAIRLDPRTGEFTEFISKTQPGPSYGMAGDRHGNGWWTQIGIDIVGFSDIKTGTTREVRLPPGTYNVVREGDLSPEDLAMYGSRGVGTQTPRRLAADPASDDIWVPTYAGQTLLRINSQTLKTTFYRSPRWGVNPYMAGVDSRGNVWMNLQNSDDLAKFDPKTEKWTFYSWPTRGTSPRGLHLMDRDGTLQLSVTYWNASRVARMVIRTTEQVDALRNQALSVATR